jgi:hypothetical protein
MNLFKILLVAVVVALALGAGSQVARASDPIDDIYFVDYFANANTIGAPDGTVRIINPGTTSQANDTEAADACAMIYIFDANQQLSECCGCFVSANALLTLSVNKNLTNNPLLGTLLKTGVIKVVSEVVSNPPKGCDPTRAGFDGKNNSQKTLRGWATHIEKVGAAFQVSVGESQEAGLGLGEATDLAEDCTVLLELGSGQGQCNCPPGH